ncbi:hypothetical protein OGAPHI_004512 [Ogataea philodendri]|uniref:Uncharacterized protein n=1 Tax=Ogataea philodendri TaxID=1378263 RepID=A0A9P8P5S0_9ASCO|nr:uncharacterized protein OGAPHI_004512 [Ogataea philodendri]KAH3666323.1 hypothetical protein OGAPHI_004512 [Ogataea philodendri]
MAGDSFCDTFPSIARVLDATSEASWSRFSSETVSFSDAEWLTRSISWLTWILMKSEDSKSSSSWSNSADTDFLLIGSTCSLSPAFESSRNASRENMRYLSIRNGIDGRSFEISLETCNVGRSMVFVISSAFGVGSGRLPVIRS